MSDEKTVKPELQVTGEQVRISNTPGLEPEQQTVLHEFETSVPFGAQGMGGGEAGLAGQVGGIRGKIEYSENAGIVANAVKSACVACRHWDNKAWLEHLKNATGPLATAEQKQTIEAMKNRILLAGFGYENADGTVDMMKTMANFGICQVLSEWVRGAVGPNPMYWPIVPWRESTCPTVCRAGVFELAVTTPAEPLGLFKPRDLEARQIGDQRRDAVLFDAAGKLR